MDKTKEILHFQPIRWVDMNLSVTYEEDSRGGYKTIVMLGDEIVWDDDNQYETPAEAINSGVDRLVNMFTRLLK